MPALKGLEWTFDTVSSTYEKSRPGYVKELYQTLLDYIPINENSNVVEVGSGGGQATAPILATGCQLTAVECGKRFCELLKDKFNEYQKFSVITGKFEDIVFEDNSFDLVFSATAFHWVPEKIGYEKVFSMLKDGGVFARFSNHPYRDKENIELFKEFVSKNGVASTDTEKISEFMDGKTYLYMIIYNQNDDTVIYESGWWDEENEDSNDTREVYTEEASDNTKTIVGKVSNSAADSDEDDAASEAEAITYVGMNEFPVKFSDRTCKVAVVDFSEEKIINTVKVISITLTAAIFFIVVFIYSSHITKRIRELSKEVVRVENADINSAINIKGKDEIAMLAKNVDSMRNKIIEQMRNEQIVWKANSDLVTAMSHDIRTPLTVLTGYLNLLKQGEYSAKEDMDGYIDICYEKAIQLKELSDKLFRYFYVFGNSEEKLETEKYNASMLFNQVVGEYVFLLNEKGYNIKLPDILPEYSIETNALYLNRLFGNIFSNIEKYADKSSPIEVSAEYKDECLIYTVQNSINQDAGKKESTGIGLLSCKKIAKQIGCSFETIDKGDTFNVKLTFVISKDEPEQGC